MMHSPDAAGVVKVRRGLVARYMIGLNSLPNLHRAFANFAAVIVHRYCLGTHCRHALVASKCLMW